MPKRKDPLVEVLNKLSVDYKIEDNGSWGYVKLEDNVSLDEFTNVLKSVCKKGIWSSPPSIAGEQAQAIERGCSKNGVDFAGVFQNVNGKYISNTIWYKRNTR